MFKVPNIIVSGEGSMKYLSQIEGEKAIIVTGGFSMKKFGFIEKAQNYLNKAGIQVIIIDDVEPNPTLETALRGSKTMLEFEPDWIIAIGGGSSLDAAKGMWIFYEHPGLDFKSIIEPNSIPKLRNKAKFIAIPSTSGTASEITGCSVITDKTTHAKYPIVSYELTPDVAILDMELPAKMPKSITAHTGIDVMSHALESYVSTIANSLTDPLALESARLVFEYLPKAYENGQNMEAREAMHHASTIAGMAFANVSLGIVHSLAHSIGGQFGITHGLANAILLPYVIEYNRQNTNKYDLIEKKLGIGNLSDAIKNLNNILGIPSSFNKLANNEISEEKFKEVLIEMSQNAYKDACTGTNPRETNTEELAELYSNAYYGLSI
ncbi:iron-containing alcohol dehydrogenase [Clostridium sp.]|jgi:alcohol dehydrogenase class IV|uniref:iron-containing alcohol dehydrogenase n=1 Tax=Clostridium sp. TaxID=1506 RepID=UPI0025848A3D|nr:iron-containing alcohol dehydrogenase [Clostridium sp.]